MPSSQPSRRNIDSNNSIWIFYDIIRTKRRCQQMDLQSLHKFINTYFIVVSGYNLVWQLDWVQPAKCLAGLFWLWATSLTLTGSARHRPANTGRSSLRIHLPKYLSISFNFLETNQSSADSISCSLIGPNPKPSSVFCWIFTKSIWIDSCFWYHGNVLHLSPQIVWN